MARDPNEPSESGEAEATHNRSDNDAFWSILERRLSRRGLLRSGAVATAAVVVGCADDSSASVAANDASTTTTGAVGATGPLDAGSIGSSMDASVPDAVAADASAADAAQQPTAQALNFNPVAHGLQDFVRVPDGYSALVLTALGDPITEKATAYRNDGSDQDFAQRIGDHGDALAFFPLPKGSTSSSDGLLVQNHEALTDVYLHAAGPTHSPIADKTAVQPRPLAEVLKEQEAHGVSLLRVAKGMLSGKWAVDRAYAGNSRWTANTEMIIAGPAAGSPQMITKLSPGADRCFGTLNNCGHGLTPWGTYLSGEENWASYFTRGDDAALDAARDKQLARQGIPAKNVDPVAKTAPGNYRGWDRADGGGDLQKRFDCTLKGATAADDFRNEPNHFGYVIELDPYAPTQPAKKRTALGRMAHEGAWFGPVVVGKPLVVYMGDDARNEYLYKFVSDAAWSAADATLGLAAGDKYLDAGKLYAAKFSDNGTGEWLLLSKDNPALSALADLADIVINPRSAADAALATKMDRPEWGAVNPKNGEFYLTLTNNSTRGTTGPAPDAANPRTYEDAKGTTSQKGNVNGHIVRLREAGEGATATSFSWDVYLFGAQSDADPEKVNVSALTADNDFSSPDGIWFDARGVLWIQTDDGAYTDVTNCMMLAAVPGQVGDGAETMVGAQKTRIGKKATVENLKRFLVGVPGCEVTGVDMTPDLKTMFVNIQHPGESGTLTKFQSNWPSMTTDDAAAIGAPTTRPRTATIVITRADGGQIGA
jgi:uncharacterized protein